MFSQQEKMKFVAAFEEVMNYTPKNDHPNYTHMLYTSHSDSFNLNTLIKFGYVEKFKTTSDQRTLKARTFVQVTPYGLERYAKWIQQQV